MSSNNLGNINNIQRKLSPGRIGTAGLEDIDFGKYKFITILKGDGSVVLGKTKLVNSESLWIKVRPDLSVKMMPKE